MSKSKKPLPEQIPDQVVEEVEQQEEETLRTDPLAGLSSILGDGSQRPSRTSLEEVVEQILAYWGGPAQLARAFYEQYHVAKPGSMIRGRALEKVLELMKVYQQMYGQGDDVDELSEDDIKAELKRILGEMQADGGAH